MDILDLSTMAWVTALSGAMVLGMNKAGIKGIGVLFVTIMALIFGGKLSTGIVLPLLLVGDVFAVSYYHRHTQIKYLKQLVPWMIVGVLMGVWVGKDLSAELFKNGMAVIILSTVILLFWWEKRPLKNPPTHWVFAGVIGLLAGFTTMVGNLAGAFTNIFFLALRIPKNHFIGTAAWLYLIINLFKVPFHIWVWNTISWETIWIDIKLIPGILVGLLLGVFLVKRINEVLYRRLILGLTALGALLIFIR